MKHRIGGDRGRELAAHLEKGKGKGLYNPWRHEHEGQMQRYVSDAAARRALDTLASHDAAWGSTIEEYNDPHTMEGVERPSVWRAQQDLLPRQIPFAPGSRTRTTWTGDRDKDADENWRYTTGRGGAGSSGATGASSSRGPSQGEHNPSSWDSDRGSWSHWRQTDRQQPRRRR